jgi:hypothetical protein
MTFNKVKWLIPFAVLLVLILSLLAGCGREEVKYEYTEEYVDILMIGGNSKLISQNMQVTTVGENKFYFERWISEEDRADYIKSQMEIFDLLAKNGIEAEGLKIYVLPDIVNYVMKPADSMFIIPESGGTVDQIRLTLQLIFGEYTNYGYVYSLSEHMAGQLRRRGDAEFSLDESVFKEKPELLNLVYPCFSSEYYAESDIESCKALSRKILGKTSNAYGGEGEFLSALDEYIGQRKTDLKRSYLEFAFGDGDRPLKIRTRFLQVFLDEDYVGSCPLTEKSVLDDPMFNFRNMLRFFEFADSDIADVRMRFGFEDDYRIPVYVQDINQGFPQGGDVAGIFYPNEVKIVAESIYTLTHEYTHYIDCLVDKSNADDNWCTEVLACYFGKNMSYAERLAIAKSGDRDVWTVEQLSELLGQPYDSAEDEIMFLSIMNAYEENPRYSVTGLYNGRLSFGNYFVTSYGEQAFIECMLSPGSAKRIIGCSVNDVLDDWCDWLENWR